MNQCELVLQYMNDFGSITTKDAFNDLGVTRLASRINDLKNAGYEIEKRFETSLNRYGQKVSYMRYSLSPAEVRECTSSASVSEPKQGIFAKLKAWKNERKKKHG